MEIDRIIINKLNDKRASFMIGKPNSDFDFCASSRLCGFFR